MGDFIICIFSSIFCLVNRRRITDLWALLFQITALEEQKWWKQLALGATIQLKQNSTKKKACLFQTTQNTIWKVVLPSNARCIACQFHIITEALSLTSWWCTRLSTNFIIKFMVSSTLKALFWAQLSITLSSFFLSASRRSWTVELKKLHKMSSTASFTWF